MVNKSQIKNGLIRYIDTELIPKTQGLQFWAMTAAGTLAANKAEALIDNFVAQPMAQSLGIADNGMIDIEAIYNAVRPAAERAPANVAIPFVGSYTLNAQDVDKLYNYILQS